MTQPDPMVLGVDMVRCAGHGICAWLYADRIGLDEWGFAHVDPQPISDRREQRRAQHAVRACPRRALRLNPAPPPPPRPNVVP